MRSRRVLLLLAIAGVAAGCGEERVASPAPPPAAREGLVVVAAGDISCPEPGAAVYGEAAAVACRQEATLAVAKAARPDLVLALGDLQYERGELEDFEAAYDRTWGALKEVTRPVPGNHEYEDEGTAEGYFDYFNGAGAADGPAGRRDEGWYSFDRGGWHFVALNSNCEEVGCEAGSRQERWLRRDLAANGERCTLAFWHHARFSSGKHGPSEGVAPLWQALQEARADVVVAAHEHAYERFAPLDAAGRPDRAGMRSFVAGTGGRNLHPRGQAVEGSQVFHNESFGVLRLVLRRDGYDWAFLPAAGSGFTDSGSARCR